MRPDQEPASMPVRFRARVVSNGNRPTVVVEGEIDLAAADEFAATVGTAMAVAPRIQIDLRDVTFIGSAGLLVLVAAHRLLGRRPEAIVLRDPSPRILRVLAMDGVDELFTIRTSAPQPAPGSPPGTASAS